ncbi:flavin monoamine oxidase family protein [Sphingomonas quercus]|uniref:Tryptophan 2-monooxygenase n=1 Tax=Sphingomonas quercus TaxID=2842451 RepID=A0ABS6BJI0_9SPHN|nr:NAD(P)/FAD-dependent oxidoreductase [Sphingomonas quercus]MBU3077350.1 FAD-dependent oxidoreductase [Sphingomonas quercus]
MTERVDVAIIGGGAAGIAAARHLSGQGRTALIVEAGARLGGRAHTVDLAGLPLDLGCGWLHSAERNPLVSLAEAKGLKVDRSEAAWGRQLRNIGAPAGDQHAAWAAYERFVESLASDPPPGDRAGDALAGEPWRPFIDALSSFINGVETDQLSARDFTAYDTAASETNWRLPSGYGAFIVSLADGLPVALGTRVEAIAEEAGGVRVDTARGTIRAGAAIVTLSTGALARGTIRFDPAVDDHLHAAAQLPLGLADKLFLSIAEPEAVPAESHLLGRFDDAATGSYYLRPFGRPVVECFLGGAHARALEEQDAAAFAIEELGSLLGASFARGLAPIAVTRWAAEPGIFGSYSHALPGHAAARAVLARPASERLAFAGEACSAQDFSTVHGAWASGIAAARWIAGGGAR